jgi:hypothetical protein
MPEYKLYKRIYVHKKRRNVYVKTNSKSKKPVQYIRHKKEMITLKSYLKMKKMRGGVTGNSTPNSKSKSAYDSLRNPNRNVLKMNNREAQEIERQRLEAQRLEERQRRKEEIERQKEIERAERAERKRQQQLYARDQNLYKNNMATAEAVHDKLGEKNLYKLRQSYQETNSLNESQKRAIENHIERHNNSQQRPSSSSSHTNTNNSRNIGSLQPQSSHQRAAWSTMTPRAINALHNTPPFSDRQAAAIDMHYKRASTPSQNTRGRIYY